MSTTKMSLQPEAGAQIETGLISVKPFELLISDGMTLNSKDSKNSSKEQGPSEHNYVKHDQDAAKEKHSPRSSEKYLGIFSCEEEVHSNKKDKLSISSMSAISKPNVYPSAKIVSTAAITVTSSESISTRTSSLSNLLSADSKTTKCEQKTIPTQNKTYHCQKSGPLVLTPPNAIKSISCTSLTPLRVASKTISVCNLNLNSVPGSVSSTHHPSTSGTNSPTSNVRVTASTQISPRPTILCSSKVAHYYPPAKKLRTFERIRSPVVSATSLQETTSKSSASSFSNIPSTTATSIRPKSSLFPNVINKSPTSTSPSNTNTRTFEHIRSPVVSATSLQETTTSKSSSSSFSNIPSTTATSIKPKSYLFPNVINRSPTSTSPSNTKTALLCSITSSGKQVPPTVVSGLCSKINNSISVNKKSHPLVFTLPAPKSVYLSSGANTSVSHTVPINSHNNQINSVSSSSAMIYTTVASPVPSTTLISSFNRPVSHYASLTKYPPKKWKHAGTNTMPINNQSVGVNTDPVTQSHISTRKNVTLENSPNTNKSTSLDTSSSANIHQNITASNAVLPTVIIKEEPDSPTISLTINTTSSLSNSKIERLTDLSNCNIVDSANSIAVSPHETIIGAPNPNTSDHNLLKRTDAIISHSGVTESPSSLSLGKRKRHRSISPDCSTSFGVSSDKVMKSNPLKEERRRESMAGDKLIAVQEEGVATNSKSRTSSLPTPGRSYTHDSSCDNKEMQAAVAAGDDADPLTEEETDFVRKKLVQLLKRALLIPNSPELRFQNSRLIEPGWFLCTCQNATSLDWLLSLKQMIGPGGRVLKIVRANELPWPLRIRFFVNSNEIDTGIMLSLLQQQNKKLRVKKWIMESHKVETKGRWFTFLVDSESEKALEEYHWTLCYEFTTIQVHCASRKT